MRQRYPCSMTIIHLLLVCAMNQATPPAPAPPAANPPAANPPAKAPADPAAKGTTGAPPAKAPAGPTDSKKPAKEKSAKKGAAKKEAAKQQEAKTEPAKEADAPPPAPAPELSPEMQKIAKLASDPKFKEYTRLAAERQELFKRSSSLRMAMRGVEPTKAQIDEEKSLRDAIAKVNDRMDACVAGKQWTQEDYQAMDFIVSEAMRLNPLE